MSQFRTDSFLSRLNRFEKGSTKVIGVPPKRNRIAESAPSYSALPNKVTWRTEGALDTIASFICLVYQTSERDGYIRMSWTDECLKQAHNKQTEGKWSVVVALARLRNITLKSVLQVLSDHFSDDDIHGNLIPLAGRISRTMKLKKQYQRQRGPVNKPQWKRGYNDKGSLRPDHQKRNFQYYSGPNPERPSLEEILQDGYRPKSKHFWQKNQIERGNYRGQQKLRHPDSSNRTQDPEAGDSTPIPKRPSCS